MTNHSTRFLALSLTLGLTVPLCAQPIPGGMFGRGIETSMLLTQKSVQDDVKMTAEQVASIEKADKDIRAKYSDEIKKAREDKNTEKFIELTRKSIEERNKALADIIKPEQTKRLKQIEIQVNGVVALQKDDVQKALTLNAKQLDEVKELAEKVRMDSQELFKEAGTDFKKFAATLAKAQALSREAAMKYVGGLSEEQQKAWKDLTGEEFKGKIEFNFGTRPQ